MMASILDAAARRGVGRGTCEVEPSWQAGDRARGVGGATWVGGGAIKRCGVDRVCVFGVVWGGK